MTVEHLIITVIVAALAGLSGFLISTSKTKSDSARREEELTSLRATTERLEQDALALCSAEKELQDNARNTELSLQQATTAAEALQDRKQELEQALTAANNKFEHITAAHHSAKKGRITHTLRGTLRYIALHPLVRAG